MKGDIIRKLRKNEDLSQTKLAEKIGVSPSTIRMIELGKREGNKNNIEKIADYFGVTVDYLEGKETNEAPDPLHTFLNLLIDGGVIKDTENIDESTQKMINIYVKQYLDGLLEAKKPR